MFFVVYVCFQCLVFVSGLHSFDYRYNLCSLDYSLINRNVFGAACRAGDDNQWTQLVLFSNFVLSLCVLSCFPYLISLYVTIVDTVVNIV